MIMKLPWTEGGGVRIGPDVVAVSCLEACIVVQLYCRIVQCCDLYTLVGWTALTSTRR